MLEEEKEEENLEGDFDDLVKKIKPKLKEASKLLKEANALCKKEGTTLQSLAEEHDYYDLISSLFHQIDEGGWRTSSIGC